MQTRIPADAARLLRDALYREVGIAGEGLHARLSSPNAPRLDWGEPVAQFDQARAVLDLIGWNERQPEPDAVLDIQPHRRTIIRALRGSLATERHLASEPGHDADAKHQRAGARARARTIEAWAKSAGLQLDVEPVEHRITVPEDCAGVLLESLLEALRDAAVKLDDCGLDPACYPGPVARFEQVRAALDAIGWGEHQDIDADTHYAALQLALAARLDLERSMLASAVESIEKGHEGGAEGRQTAYRYTLVIEALMHDAGLEIPEAGER